MDDNSDSICSTSPNSDIVVPLTGFTLESIPWNFIEEARQSFYTLRSALPSVPVLTHCILDHPIIIKTDVSDYALEAILSISTDSGDIHPVAFHSRPFTSPELNYDTHDKELLAIFEAFWTWQRYLKNSVTPIIVINYHASLEYFRTAKVLSRRQLRWSDFLSSFNLSIRLRPGFLGTNSDSLFRQWDVYRKRGNSDYATVNPSNYQPIFSQEQL